MATPRSFSHEISEAKNGDGELEYNCDCQRLPLAGLLVNRCLVRLSFLGGASAPPQVYAASAAFSAAALEPRPL